VKDEIRQNVDSVKEVATQIVDSTKSIVETAIAKEKEELANEGTELLDSIKSGNIDSVSQRIETLFGKKKGSLDSLAKRIPIPIFGKKKKKGSGW